MEHSRREAWEWENGRAGEAESGCQRSKEPLPAGLMVTLDQAGEGTESELALRLPGHWGFLESPAVGFSSFTA